MGKISTDLAALIGSRICHDLISPIGAINNGLELLSMSGNPPGPEIGLIGDSVDSANARIRFFRIAFGAAGEQMVGPVEIRSILQGLYDGSRLSVRWDQEDAVPQSEVRMCFLAILCAESAMPYGGDLGIMRPNGKWQIEGHADRINLDDDVWRMLSGGPNGAPLQPSQVQFALLPLVAGEKGRKVFCRSDETALTMEF